MQSILLIGSQGQVGRELQSTLLPYGTVIEAARNEVDLTDLAAVRSLIRRIQPTVVVNAAAYTAVDRAEQEPELAALLNAQVPQVLAQECERLGAALLHISTDYVFDGQGYRPYREDDLTHPLSIYGQTKRAGEQAIQETKIRHGILRTAWVYGAYGKGNFVKTMLRLGAEREELGVVADQIGSPTWAGDIAQALGALLPKILAKPEYSGIYHYTDSGVASWYDLAIAIFEEARSLGYPLTLQRIAPLTSEEYPTPARRPHYSVLDCGKITAILGTRPPHWRQSLRLMLQELYTQTYERADSLRR